MENSPISDNLLLTTALKSGGWVPETSRSFQYWQPAPIWRLLSWLANTGNPAMSLHMEGKEIKHPSHRLNCGKRKGRKKGGAAYEKSHPCSGKMLRMPMKCQMLQCTCKHVGPRACGIPTHASISAQLTAKEGLVLLVVSYFPFQLCDSQIYLFIYFFADCS